MRSTMGQDRLSDLALMHVKYSLPIELDEVVNLFAMKHPRKMLLLDILGDSQ